MVIFCLMEDRMISLLSCMPGKVLSIVSFTGEVSIVVEGHGGDDSGEVAWPGRLI